MKRRQSIGIAVFLLIALLALNWVRTHTIVYVSITNPAESRGHDIEYTLIKQGGDPAATIVTKEPNIRRIVPRANYEVRVSKDASSAIAFTQTSGFLQTTSLDLTLSSEKSRKFVGNQPQACMFYEGNLLYSFPCGSSGEITAHMPANHAQPTTVRSSPASSLPIVSMFRSATGSVKVVANTSGGSSDTAATLFDINSSLVLSEPFILEGSGIEHNPQFIAYRDGFLLYEPGLRTVRYYPTTNEQPGDITTQKPPSSIENPVELSTFEAEVGALFNGTGVSEEGDEGISPVEANTPLGGNSAFVFFGDSADRTYTFNVLYTSGGLCGRDLLCLNSNGQLDVYKIDGDESSLLFSMDEVQEVLGFKDRIVVFTNSSAIGINTKTAAGSVEYSYPSREFCGTSAYGNGYVICLNNNGNKVALFIDSASSSDGIDKKVFSLEENPNITAVSAYGNYIYISPNLGQMVYNESLKSYGYDPEVATSANKAINEQVRELGINTSKYFIFNPAQ